MFSRTMRIDTAHFGHLTVNTQDALCFPLGLPGLEDCRRWVWLVPPDSPTVSWFQSVERPSAALAVVDPRRFVPDYQLRTYRRELDCLELGSPDEASVLVTLNRTPRGLALNLKAPLVINRVRRLGRQVISNGDWPVQFVLDETPPRTARKIA
ncbi:MAG TPA: flagellar assembly protein FliW [Thermoguttaceae bacterium]|nr:flagellar assembly protein FliW [Thermoguttaceae bacterium]